MELSSRLSQNEYPLHRCNQFQANYISLNHIYIHSSTRARRSQRL
ncbi:hypothetical protein LINPERPRIM_LOCUS22236 [Linum perenne]